MNRTAWVILAGGVAAAAALTGSAPLAVLVLGPLLLGVPHVLGDVRFLVSRPL